MSYDSDIDTMLHEQMLFEGRPVHAGIHRLSGDLATHTHDFVEIAVVGPGRGRHLAGRGDHNLRLGDVMVLRPGAWHGFARCEGLMVANCCISTQAIRDELAPLRQLPIVNDLIWTGPTGTGTYGVARLHIGADAAGQVIEDIDRLAADLSGPRPRPGRTLGQLVTILGTLSDARQSRTPRTIHPAVTAVVDRLEETPQHPWRLPELAAAVGLDPDYLGRVFRRHTGVSVLDYLARLRIERAAALLTRTTLPVARIGARVGWDDPTYFARRFRELTGITPTGYRQTSPAAE